MFPHGFRGSMLPVRSWWPKARTPPILSLFNKEMHYASARMSARISLLTNITDVGIRR